MRCAALPPQNVLDPDTVKEGLKLASLGTGKKDIERIIEVGPALHA